MLRRKLQSPWREPKVQVPLMSWAPSRNVVSQLAAPSISWICRLKPLFITPGVRPYDRVVPQSHRFANSANFIPHTRRPRYKTMSRPRSPCRSRHSAHFSSLTCSTAPMTASSPSRFSTSRRAPRCSCYHHEHASLTLPQTPTTQNHLFLQCFPRAFLQALAYVTFHILAVLSSLLRFSPTETRCRSKRKPRGVPEPCWSV